MSLQPKANLQLVYVSDVVRSTEFYKKIFKAEPVFSSPRYVAFSADSNDEALFAIWSGGETPDKEIARFSEIGILLPTDDDVDNLFDSWRKDSEINIIREPYDEVFGRTFLVSDPDGHIIRVSPRD